MLMLMLMLMFMAVAVTIAVIMHGVMTVIAHLAGIGAAQGIERCQNLGDLCPKTFQHGLDDMIPQDQYPLKRDFGWKVPVADVPGKLAKRLRT